MKTILVDAWNTFVTKDGVNKEMLTILESFPNKKIILTNADKEKQSELGLIDLPYELFTLNFNPKKTDGGYYEKFLEENNLTAKDVIYFEHDIEAVNKAEQLGIKTFYYDKDKKDLNSLKQFLLDNL